MNLDLELLQFITSIFPSLKGSYVFAFAFFALGFGVATIIWQAMFWEIRKKGGKPID